MYDSSHKTAASSVIASWALWAISHIEQINEVMQFFVLLTAIISSVCAAVYYYRKAKRL